MSLLATAFVVASLAPLAPQAAEDDKTEAPLKACCRSAALDSPSGACPSCNPGVASELPPLSPDADAKARRLRGVYAQALASRNAFLNPGLVEELRALWEARKDSANATERLAAESAYAMFLLQQGRTAEALPRFLAAAEIARGDDFATGVRCEVLLRLGLAYFRLAERANCIAHHNSQSCIFPLAEAAQHVDPEGARKAQAVLEEVLALDPSYTEARWLLNIANMALGTWPDDVPEEHLIPPSRFASEEPMGRFADVAPDAGVGRFTRAGSVLLDDFDGDGRIDVLTSTFDPARSLRLFHNRGDGGFTDVTELAGLADQLGGLNMIQADVDGDGRLDVLVLRGGELFFDGAMPCSLLRQATPGVFADITAAAGVDVDAPTQTAAAADVDKDGDVDLFVGYESIGRGDDGLPLYPSRLYRNDGAAVFKDVAADAGVENRRDALGAVFGDIDGDGFPDLYISNRRNQNRLYVNDGAWGFKDVAVERGVTEPLVSRVPVFFDQDNDGDLDLFVAHHEPHGAERRTARFYIDGTVEGDTGRLYENDGKGCFEDVTAARGLRRALPAMGANAGDVDGDGWPDLYLGTGAEGMAALFPNVLLRNDRGRAFRDVTTAAGVGHLQKANGIAFADLDCDGDQDLFVQVGGFFLDDGFGDVLFENPGAASHWLVVELEGVGSNRFGIGSRVRARIEEPDGTRDVYAFVGAGGSHGRGPLRAELGLGRAQRILELEVLWPASGESQVFSEVPLDRFVRVREGRAELEELDRTPFRLGRPLEGH